MFEGLYAAAAGMAAQQRSTDALANDMANLDTPGYKPVRVRFHDLLESRQGEGAGAAADFAGRSWAQGTLYQTDRPLDLAIEGKGFFAVKGANGVAELTRDGAFQLDASGRLTTADGKLVMPGVTVPPGTGAGDVDVAANGIVSACGVPIGHVRIVDVSNEDGLLARGSGLFTATRASGPSRTVAGARVHQQQLEASSADAMELVGGQHAFDLLSRVITMHDQMLGTANSLKQ